MNTKISILGIDPGSINTGYALIYTPSYESFSLHNFNLIDVGLFYSNPKNSFYQRLAQMHHKIDKIISFYKPDHCVFEDAFVGYNPRTSMKLGQVRGAILASAFRHSNTRVHHLTPAQVKKTITGSGQSTKKQVGFFVKSIINDRQNNSSQKIDHLSEDAIDALAIAIGWGMFKSTTSKKPLLSTIKKSPTETKKSLNPLKLN